MSIRLLQFVACFVSVIWAIDVQAYDASEFAKRLNRLQSGNAEAQVVGGSGGTETPQQLFNEILGTCQAALKEFTVEAKSRQARSENVAIGGTLAGVLGSALTGHVSTLFTALMSGTSGAANAVQQAYAKEGDTSVQALTNYQAARKDAMAAIDEFTNATTDQQRINAVNKLNAKCTLVDVQIPAAPK